MKIFLHASFFATIALSSLVQAQTGADYPNRPVKLIVPSAAGGGADALGRLLADHLGKKLKQSFFVENIGGASGTIAINQLAHVKPDGYVIGLGTMSTVTLAPAAQKNLPYDPVKNLTMLARIGMSPVVMVVTNDVPANNLKEFIALAKKSAQPIQYGTWGEGSTGHFCASVLEQKAGVKLDHIPFKGAGPVATAMLGDVIKVGYLDAGSALSAINTGKIKALAMCTRRMENFPNVATYKEQGVDFDQWTGWTMIAPAGMPKPVVNKIGNALQEILKDPNVINRMRSLGVAPEFLPGEEQAAINARDIQVWKKVAKDANIKLE